MNTPPEPDYTARDAAIQAHADARKRWNEQATVIEARERDVANAKTNLAEALKGVAKGKGGSPSDAQRALRAAQDDLELALSLRDAMHQHAEEMAAAMKAAESAAWQPILRHAAQESVAACEDYHAALSALSAAIKRKLDATQLARKAKAFGCNIPMNGAHLDPVVNHPMLPQLPEFTHRLASPETEREMWRGVL